MAMIVAVCVDDRGGLQFHNRRQSQDRLQREDLLALCPGRLWMDSASAPLFYQAQDRIFVDDGFLEKAGPGTFCFVERPPLAPVAERLEAVVLYRWNRVYPADAWLDLDLDCLALTERREFPGTSHPRITREIYQRRAL